MSDRNTASRGGRDKPVRSVPVSGDRTAMMDLYGPANPLRGKRTTIDLCDPTSASRWR